MIISPLRRTLSPAAAPKGRTLSGDRCSQATVKPPPLAGFPPPPQSRPPLHHTGLEPLADQTEVRLIHRSDAQRNGAPTCGPPCRRKTRHTTHVEVPQFVKIIRPHHPFEGQSLEVFGRLHRQGRLRLILVLPDGSRSLVPADWTDLPGRQAVAAGEPSTQAALFGTVADLLQARTLIDALLRRLSLSREESQRAAEPELPSDPTTPRGRGLGASRRPATPSRRQPAGAPAGQGRLGQRTSGAG